MLGPQQGPHVKRNLTDDGGGEPYQQRNGSLAVPQPQTDPDQEVSRPPSEGNP